MEDFRFHDPQYLSALLLVPGLIILAWITRDLARKRLLRFAGEDALSRLLVGNIGFSLLSLRKFLFYVSIACFSLALARPQGNPVDEMQKSMGLDIMVVLDTSRSMDSEDVYPSRLKKAKREINTLLDHLGGDRVGIVAFASSAALMAPLTSDYEVVRSFLDAIDTTTIQSQGSNIAAGLNLAVDAFQRGGQGGLSPEDKSNLILLMSDGEAHEGSSYEAVEQARKLGITIYTIAFGTEKGVPIPIRDPQGQLLSYKRDARGENVISKVNPEGLKEIAAHGGGVFYFSTLDEGEIADILARTANFKRGENKEVKGKIYEEYFPYVLFPGVILLLLSLLPARRAPILALLALLLLSGQASAGDLPPQSALWDKNHRLSEEALQKYRAGKFSDATEILKSLQVENPDSPAVAYDLGTALLKDKKFAEGRSTLAEASKAGGLEGLAARMNLAGSYAEEKNIAKAQSEYSSIVHELQGKENPKPGEVALMERAKKNLELLSPKEQEKQKQQQQQQNQENKNQENREQQNQQGQEKQGNDKDQKEKDKKTEQAQEQPKPSEDNKQYDMRHKPFEEQKDMSEQDAKRMLEALKQQEKAAQKKFLKKLGNDSKLKDHENVQDW